MKDLKFKEMLKELKNKIKLFRILHGINEVFVSVTGELFKDQPENFTGKCLWWFENGQLGCDGDFKNGERHGKWFEWYKNGQLEWEGNWKDGEYHGKWLRWYSNGQLECEENWKNGEKHGKWLEWYENGQLAWEWDYKDGERID